MTRLLFLCLLLAVEGCASRSSDVTSTAAELDTSPAGIVTLTPERYIRLFVADETSAYWRLDTGPDADPTLFNAYRSEIWTRKLDGSDLPRKLWEGPNGYALGQDATQVYISAEAVFGVPATDGGGLVLREKDKVYAIGKANGEVKLLAEREGIQIQEMWAERDGDGLFFGSQRMSKRGGEVTSFPLVQTLPPPSPPGTHRSVDWWSDGICFYAIDNDHKLVAVPMDDPRPEAARVLFDDPSRKVWLRPTWTKITKPCEDFIAHASDDNRPAFERDVTIARIGGSIVSVPSHPNEPVTAWPDARLDDKSFCYGTRRGGAIACQNGPYESPFLVVPNALTNGMRHSGRRIVWSSIRDGLHTKLF